MRLGEFQSCCGHFEGEENILLLPGFKAQTIHSISYADHALLAPAVASNVTTIYPADDGWMYMEQ